MKFILVKVPLDSEKYYINKVGCLRYSQYEDRVSSCVEPTEIGEYLEENLHSVEGESIYNNEKFVVIKIK